MVEGCNGHNGEAGMSLRTPRRTPVFNSFRKLTSGSFISRSSNFQSSKRKGWPGAICKISTRADCGTCKNSRTSSRKPCSWASDKGASLDPVAKCASICVCKPVRRSLAVQRLRSPPKKSGAWGVCQTAVLIRPPPSSTRWCWICAGNSGGKQEGH